MDIFPIGIILLSFLFGYRPISHGRPQSERSNSHTEY